MGCGLGLACSRFRVCFIWSSVAKITRFLSTSWNLKDNKAYFCSSQGLSFGRILSMLLFSIFFRIVWILLVNRLSSVFASPYSFFVRSLTSGKCSCSSKDAISLARSNWYSPFRKRMLTGLVSEPKVCFKNSI